jgi:pimeloyl-ACP methyl ester carboxylesterase
LKDVVMTATVTAASPTIVLVHGAWSDASAFDSVRQILDHDGFVVECFANPLRSLSGDTAHLTSFLRTRTRGSVVLVGHSYGGALISAAASRHPDTRALVYLNGFVPDHGESILGLSGRAGPVDADTLFDKAPLPGNDDVDLYLTRDAFANGCSHGLTTQQTATYFAAQRPITANALSEPAAADPAWKNLPTWYVAGTQDRIIDIATQLFMAERAGSTLTRLSAGHLAVVSQSPIIASIIKTAATSVTRPPLRSATTD